MRRGPVGRGRDVLVGVFVVMRKWDGWRGSKEVDSEGGRGGGKERGGRCRNTKYDLIWN